MSSPKSEYVIDAHALIWYLTGSPRLGINARVVLTDAATILYLPIIALAEACWAVERGKTNVPTVAALLADVDADPRITVVPLDRNILDRAQVITSVHEMHDRQIAATALYLSTHETSVSLLTCDADIVASKVVPIVW